MIKMKAARKVLIKQFITAVILTTLIFSTTVFFTSETSSLAWFKLALLVTFFSFGLPNGVFLLITYWLNIGGDFIFKTKLLIIEIILLALIFHSINHLIILIPNEIKYYTTPNSYGIKFIFQAGAVILYSFIILLFTIFFIDRLIIQRSKNK